MVLQFDLEASLLSKGTNKLWVNVDTCDIALLECDTILVELLVQ